MEPGGQGHDSGDLAAPDDDGFASSAHGNDERDLDEDQVMGRRAHLDRPGLVEKPNDSSAPVVGDPYVVLSVEGEVVWLGNAGRCRLGRVLCRVVDAQCGGTPVGRTTLAQNRRRSGREATRRSRAT